MAGFCPAAATCHAGLFTSSVSRPPDREGEVGADAHHEVIAHGNGRRT